MREWIALDMDNMPVRWPSYPHFLIPADTREQAVEIARCEIAASGHVLTPARQLYTVVPADKWQVVWAVAPWGDNAWCIRSREDLQ